LKLHGKSGVNVIDLVIKKHLNNFDSQQKIVLTDLCNLISDELPTATQTIKYGIPTFLIEGVAIIGFDGYKKHNSLFPYSGSTNMLLEKELAGYEQTKGSIHFAIDKRFPKPLLRKIIKARISQINASYPKRTGEYLEFYANGVLKAKGKMKNEQLHGDWKWFRRDGVIMRSGSFKNGKQTGIWITYDQKGKSYKKTNFGS
jgi:uncharacterized protein YdhG (YjbR/CyaY superfamily)